MPADDDAIPPSAVGALTVRGFARHEVAERCHEPFELERCGERNFRVEGEHEESQALTFGACLHARDVADDGGGGVDQVAGGEAILRIGADGRRVAAAHHRRIDDKRVGARGEQPLDAAATLALLDELEEARRFEGAQVVVHALPAEGQLRGQLGGRCRRAQPVEELAPDWRQRESDAVRFLDEGDSFSHGTAYIRKKILSNTAGALGAVTGDIISLARAVR